MLKFKHMIRRRTFIKTMGVQLLALIAGDYLSRIPMAGIAQAASSNNPYGGGPYGAGPYGQTPDADYRIYLPSVIKEGY
jgi:hypothetical protein